MKIDAPNFPVGPEVTREIFEMLSNNPLIGEREIASSLSADQKHPFFQTDLALARLYFLSISEPVSTTRIIALESEQWSNVTIAIALKMRQLAITETGVDVETAEKVLPIIDVMNASSLTKDNLLMAIWADKFVSAVSSIAGEIDVPIETLMREYLDMNSRGLTETPIQIDEIILKKVLSINHGNETEREAIEAQTKTDINYRVSEEGTEGNPDATRQPENKIEEPPKRAERRPSVRW